VSLLFLILIINIAVWNNASNDPSHVVIKGYYDQAVNYGETARQDSISNALGWEVGYRFIMPEATSVDAAESGYPPNSRVALDIVDAQGLAVLGASVRLIAFHLAHSATPIDVDVQATDSGYFCDLRLGPAGLWNLSLQVQKGDTLFTHRIQKELVAAP